MLNEVDTPRTPGDGADEARDVQWRRRERAENGLAQIVVTSLLVALAFVAGWFGNGYVNRANYVSSPDERLVLQAWKDITDNFVITDQINTKKMAYAAISGMVDSLDDKGHSIFLTPEDLAREQQSIDNKPTVGIGVLLSGGGSTPLTIEAIIDGSPASKSQLKVGDQIVAVNGQDIAGKSYDQVRPLITGEKGTQVRLTLVRPSSDPNKRFDITITRDAYTVPLVESYVIPEVNVGFIRITQFSRGTNDQLKPVLRDLKAKGVSSIVLDLRGNPGGLLDEAVNVASEFIPAGPGKNVLITRDRTSRSTEAVKPGGLATDTPIAVLTDGNTASAAEIVTGAIKVNRPETHVVGEKTFGTGTVLNLFQLADGSALRLGVQEFLLPDGTSIYHNGFKPDTEVALPQGVGPVSPLIARDQSYGLQQLRDANDTQLLKALQLLTGRDLSKAA